MYGQGRRWIWIREGWALTTSERPLLYTLWIADWDDGKARMSMGQVGDLFDVSGWWVWSYSYKLRKRVSRCEVYRRIMTYLDVRSEGRNDLVGSVL